MADDKKSWQQQLASFAKGIVTEAVMPAAEKMIPQGAAELSQALFTGSGYVPYGPTEKPVPMEDHHGVYGPQQAQEQPKQQNPEAAVAAPQESYASMLATYAATAEEQQHNRETQR